ncbi:MAG: HTH domain-containing protein [Paracoccaceae bacterium]|nr:HTH domain-containing protein [Paracoccaceae bacterium]MDP7186564.1 HTH domain-containing protein [Paracoccaceae bacterium]
MPRSDRLHALLSLLQDGKTHRAQDLAQRFGVTPRTIYRDMARLCATGAPVQGTPGTGYRATSETTLPPLNLSGAELEVFRLGLGVISDAGDDIQKAAALSLLGKLDTALAEGPSALSPTPPSPRLQQHLARIRQAIATRQRLRISQGGYTAIIRPLRLDFFGRIWRCICWDETADAFDDIPLTDITALAVLPSLFVEEPGKTLKDYLTH